MKKIIFLLFGFVLLISSCQKEPVAPVKEVITPKPPPANPYTREAVISELNYARMNPKEYAEIIRERRKASNPDSYTAIDGYFIHLEGGYKLFDETIKYLDSQQYLDSGSLLPSKGLDSATKYHVDMGPKGYDILDRHFSSDGKDYLQRQALFLKSWSPRNEFITFGHYHARDIVVLLLLSDRIPDIYRYREGILSYNYEYKYVGVAMGMTKQGYMCVIDFAAAVVEKD